MTQTTEGTKATAAEWLSATPDFSYRDAVELLADSVRDTAALPEVNKRLSLLLAWFDADHEVVTAGQAAEMLGVSINTVKKWSDLGRFPSAYQTPGGHWRFRISEVLALRDDSQRARFLNSTRAPVRQEQVAAGDDPYADGLSQ